MSGVPASPTAAEAIASAAAVSDWMDEAMPPAVPADAPSGVPGEAGEAGGPSGGAAAAGGAAPAAGPVPARPPGPGQQGGDGQSPATALLPELELMLRDLEGRELVVNGLTSVSGLTDGPNPLLEHTTDTSFIADKFHKESRLKAPHTCLGRTQRWICARWLDYTTRAELFSGRSARGNKAAVDIGAFKVKRADGHGRTLLVARCKDNKIREVNPRIHRDKDPCVMSFPTSALDADMQRLVDAAKAEDEAFTVCPAALCAALALEDAADGPRSEAQWRAVLKRAAEMCDKDHESHKRARRGPDNTDPPLDISADDVWESLGPLREPVAHVVQAFFPDMAPQRVPVSILGQVLNALCLDSVSAAVSVLALPPRADSSSSSDDDSEEEGAAGAAGAEAEERKVDDEDDDDSLCNAVVAVMTLLGRS